jgi:hypothetical protein
VINKVSEIQLLKLLVIVGNTSEPNLIWRNVHMAGSHCMIFDNAIT